jgi:hypothetical protein
VLPLSRADTAALVQALAPPGLPAPLVSDLAQDAWRVSDGNAFVVVEVNFWLSQAQGLRLGGEQPIRQE